MGGSPRAQRATLEKANLEPQEAAVSPKFGGNGPAQAESRLALLRLENSRREAPFEVKSERLGSNYRHLGQGCSSYAQPTPPGRQSDM